MPQLAEHPTVKRFREKEAARDEPPRPLILDAEWLRHICIEAGADDVGFVELARPATSWQLSPTPGRS
jgi:hypothetical protein